MIVHFDYLLKFNAYVSCIFYICQPRDRETERNGKERKVFFFIVDLLKFGGLFFLYHMKNAPNLCDSQRISIYFISIWLFFLSRYYGKYSHLNKYMEFILITCVCFFFFSLLFWIFYPVSRFNTNIILGWFIDKCYMAFSISTSSKSPEKNSEYWFQWNADMIHKHTRARSIDSSRWMLERRRQWR